MCEHECLLILQFLLHVNHICLSISSQVQLEPTTSWALLHRNMYGRSKYTGMLQAAKDILREEGLPVLTWSFLLFMIRF